MVGCGGEDLELVVILKVLDKIGGAYFGDTWESGTMESRVV